MMASNKPGAGKPVDCPTRRQVISAAGAAIVALSVRQSTASEPPVSQGAIIDTHQHLWDLSRFRLPWLDHAGPLLNHTHTTEDYLRAAEGLHVERAVYMEVAVEAGQRTEEAEYVIDLCRRKAGPTVAAVIGGAPERADFAMQLDRFKGNAYVKGVRSSFDAGAGGEGFIKNLRHLGSLGLTYDINTGPAGLERAAAVVADCPDTRFVLDHCGNVDAAVFRPDAPPAARQTRTQWQQGIAKLADLKRVVCKISGVLEAAADGARAGEAEYAAVINHCLDSFGPDRVMFASNWPVVNRGGSFASWVKLLRSIVGARPAPEVRKLFRDNAQRFYRLDPP